ncbi:hypothetical protein DNY73_24960 [Salmonella enterica subsp. diarizonae]|uniref:Uncharacterized protein n=1 Tax=Salmonella enterica TaxID=28901 RepID=A0A7U5YN48_SALER|nr:hypothetical protein CHC34_04420 [Salmonella enterica]EAA2984721.1 hypothetical protein [Salmonella enterica subsp. diarizonae]EAS9239348.1 hypothetical protein [Salmonella enterica subsp. enterica]EBW4112709.1 hypothetical protein [Salmonella enterica subsp. enterica serovar Oranienburg]EAA9289037.1 hypothetical protein [Salmonella enterica]
MMTQATSSRRTHGGMTIMIIPCPSERGKESPKPKNGLRNKIKQVAPIVVEMTIVAIVTAGV